MGSLERARRRDDGHRCHKLRELFEEFDSGSQVRPEHAPRAVDLRRRERSVPRTEADPRNDGLLEVRAESGGLAQVGNLDEREWLAGFGRCLPAVCAAQ